MGFWKRLFSKKIISSVRIVDHTDGLNEEEKLDDEVVLTFLRKYDDITGKYETSTHIFYGDLDVLTYVNGELDDKTHGVFFEFLKDYKR